MQLFSRMSVIVLQFASIQITLFSFGNHFAEEFQQKGKLDTGQ